MDTKSEVVWSAADDELDGDAVGAGADHTLHRPATRRFRRLPETP
ncbi:hypothetical protein [Streptomyces sp. NBC_00078]|nr:hypothetical protein [Streptomyces sp. NBC_00078]MCX5420917.1 hypothetical protein [Streptomyces sp. NBC_00078]